jgi:predicted XRE-type DNA-binding protein
MNEEAWKAVVGYEGLYEVSSFGKVQVLARTCIYSDGRKHFIYPREMKLADSYGYKAVSLIKDGWYKRYQVHRLVAIAFIPQTRPDAVYVNHKDCNKANNLLENLEWVTHRENTDHAIDNDRYNAAVNAKCRKKFTLDDIENVNRLLAEGRLNQLEISNLTGISPSHVSRIKRKTIWQGKLEVGN